jgi:hypothetical protein
MAATTVTFRFGTGEGAEPGEYDVVNQVTDTTDRMPFRRSCCVDTHRSLSLSLSVRLIQLIAKMVIVFTVILVLVSPVVIMGNRSDSDSDSDANSWSNSNSLSSVFDTTVTSKAFYTAIVVSLAMTSNTILEVLLNLFSASTGISYEMHGPIIILAPVMLVYNLIVLLDIIPTRNLSLFWCILNAHDYLGTSNFMFYLMRFGGQSWSFRSPLVQLLFLLYSVIFLSRAYSLRSDGYIDQRATIVSMTVTVLAWCLISYQFIGYVRYVRNKPTPSMQDFFCVMYSGVLVMGNLATIIFYCGFGVVNLSLGYLISYTYVLQLLLMTVYAVHSRLNVLEMATSDASTIAEKTRFVRYVSHEVGN